ncbi:hypothetical protein ACJX0J_036784, partial [Zea mays]
GTNLWRQLSLLDSNNYIHFITYNAITHNLFYNGRFCSLLQNNRANDFINNIFILPLGSMILTWLFDEYRILNDMSILIVYEYAVDIFGLYMDIWENSRPV